MAAFFVCKKTEVLEELSQAVSATAQQVRLHLKKKKVLE